jgi:tetratricopeptide (TPR) repeat protein
VNARLILVPLCVALEGCAGLLVLSSPTLLSDVLAGVGLHTGASALFGWTAGRSRSGSSDRVTALLAGLVALLGFPMFGMVAILSGSLATAALALRPRRSQAPAATASTTSVPTGRVVRAQDSRLDPLSVLDVEPIVDVLSGADPVLKRGGIDALVRSQGYRAVSTLRSLLLDAESEIRLYASVTLNTLEDDIGHAMLAARSATRAASPDAAAWEKLAWLYVEYASCGFIAQPTVDQYLDLAHSAYEAAMDQKPDQSGLALALGRAHLLFGQLDIAEQYFESAAMSRIRNPEAHLALMELAYKRGALAEVAQRASTAARLLPFEYPQRALVNWWVGRA